MRSDAEGGDLMGHTPYGYRIENGAAVINESEAECIRQIFDNYISGMSLAESAKAAGHPVVHSSVKRILCRECYTLDDLSLCRIDDQMPRLLLVIAEEVSGVHHHFPLLEAVLNSHFRILAE